MRRNPSERFWAKVEPRPNGCWEWTGARFKSRQGVRDYGMFVFEGRIQHANRVAWMLLYGPIPDGLRVLHTCDNPPCVRPTHLELGTHRKNMEQMVSRRRFVHGIRHHSNRLTEDQVRTIKRRLALGESPTVIARDYPVTQAAIFLIAAGKNWKWLDAA